MPGRPIPLTLSLTLTALCLPAVALADPLTTPAVGAAFGERHECSAVNAGAAPVDATIVIRDGADGGIVDAEVVNILPGAAGVADIWLNLPPRPQLYCQVLPALPGADLRVSMRRLNYGGQILERATASSSPDDATTPTGARQIDQACAAGNGCFPGDQPGFPVEIVETGSYSLRSNLTIDDATLGAILIEAPDVSLDLAGFTIKGPVTCGTETPVEQCGPVSEAVGIEATGTGVSIANGAVRGFDFGIRVFRSSAVRDLLTTENSSSGLISTGNDDGHLFSRIRAIRNGGNGITSSSSSPVVVDSTAIGNGSDGIFAGGGTVENCTARDNRSRGLFAVLVRGSTARTNGVGIESRRAIDNRAAFNRGAGIRYEFEGGYASGNTLEFNGVGLKLADKSGFLANLMLSNEDAAVERSAPGDVVTDLGQNLCDGAACVVVDP